MDLSKSIRGRMVDTHIVWAPKVGRKIIYGKYRKEIGTIICKLCTFKEIEIVETNACIDHIHVCLVG